MTANQIVLRVIAELERLGIEYMLVGSYSSNAFGLARSTLDADFVLQVDDRQLRSLVKALEPQVTFDAQARLETVTGTMRFVGRHAESGFKIELFQTSDDEHDGERFRRRQRRDFLGTTAMLPSAEDVIVQKLRWFSSARRAKDLEDAKNVLAVQMQTVDLNYIRQWCDRHGTLELFESMMSDVKRVQQIP